MKSTKKNKNKITYDHAYTADPNHKYIRDLEKMGFYILPSQVEHPGRSFCRFIAFRQASRDPWQYMEFIDRRGSRGQYKQPGLSLSYGEDLSKLYDILHLKSNLAPQWRHRNYDWKQDSKSKLPGWNFVSFKRLGISTFYPWFTQYEPRPGKKKRQTIQHPNGITRIKGIELQLNSRGRKIMSEVFQRPLLPSQILENNTTLWTTEAKANRFSTIVLESNSMGKTRKFLKKATTTVWKGQSALRLANPSNNKLMWDIVVVPRERKHEPMSDCTNETISKIRNLVNRAHYKQARRLVEKDLKSAPTDIYLRYHYAVLVGESMIGLTGSELQNRRQTSVTLLKQLMPQRKRFNKDYESRLLNEYYWFSGQYRKQYELGLREIRTGYLPGYYSMGVGACWYAKTLIEKQQFAKALFWAKKSVTAWEKYFAYQSKWYNSWLFYGVANEVLGQKVAANRAFQNAGKISGKKRSYLEIAEKQKLGQSLRLKIEEGYFPLSQKLKSLCSRA